MPKATLTFDLPEEQSEFNIATRGGEFYCALMDIINELRNHNKYDKKIEECFEEIERIVNEFNLEGIC